jgi:hypothetical protein
MSMLSGEAAAQTHGDCWVNEGSPNNCLLVAWQPWRVILRIKVL